IRFRASRIHSFGASAFLIKRGLRDPQEGASGMSIRVYALRRIGSAPAFRFGLVGLTGIAINQIVLGLLTEVSGLYYLLSAIAATQFSSTWNFVGTENWAFAGRQFRGHIGQRYFTFMAISNSTLLLRIPLLWILQDLLGINYLLGNLISLAVMF